MASDYLRPYVFLRTMDLLHADRDEDACCGACASLGSFDADEPPHSDQPPFTYAPHEPLAVRVRGGGDFRVRKAVVVVGRSAERADIVLRDPVISRIQCRFVFAHGRVEVEDLGSACGTVIGGSWGPQMITRTTLREGDIVRVGNSELEIVRL